MVRDGDVGSEAVDRRQGGDARETGAHIGVCLHCLNSRQVTPLRVDHHSAVVFSDQEAGRDPAIEPGNDIVSVLTQELNELRLIFRLDGQKIDERRDLFRHCYCRVYGFSKNILFSVLTP